MKIGTLLRINDISCVSENFANLCDMGFNSCQLVYKPAVYTEEDAKLIRSAANEYGVDISAQFCGYYDNDTVWDNYYGYMNAGLGVDAYRKSRLDYLKSAARFAHAAGIEDIVIHAGFIPNNPFSPEYPPLLSAVRTLCVYCADIGVNVLLETGGEAAISLLRLITDVDTGNLFVNLDPANMLMYGYANPVDALYTVGKYVRNIHGKDGMPPTDPKKLGAETPVGEGMVDFPAMLSSLKKLGYDRYITIERENVNAEAHRKDILKAKAYFEDLLRQLDYEIQ